MTAGRSPAGSATKASRMTIFLGSFLLFLVQPMVGRTLLPAFGGTAAVWVVCLCAFQTLLLAGYVHAHRVASGPPRLRTAHLWLLALAAVWAFCAHWAWARLGGGAFSGGGAAWRALLCVAGLCGFPYVMLSTNSSLVQSLAAAGEGRGAYRLYAVSNAGSLCGLLAYPLLMEPFVAVGAQWRIFGIGMAIYALLLATLVRRCGTAAGPRETAEAVEAPEGRHSTLKVVVLAVALPALSTFLLDALTTHVTLDVMPMPMMWCLLLAIFLASYIVGFTSWAERNVRWLGLAATAALFVLCTVMARPPARVPTWARVGSHLFILAAGCTFIHAWLYSSRPGAKGLTRFYLLGAVGGAAGGMAASLAAPMVFDQVTEWPIALALTAIAALCWFAAQARSGFAAACSAIVAALLCGGALWMGWRGTHMETRPSVYRARGFYGTISVLESKARNGKGEGFVREFCHGTTVHGIQAILPGVERMPTTYYTPDASGYAIAAHPKYRSGEPMRVNITGLGIGVMFCYGRPNDYYRAYEISPDALAVATDTNLFTFVADCPAKKEIVLGDARQGLEDELRRGVEPYDVIVVDAFTGDNLPYHLSTREAFDLYFKLLKPDGILCVNISNWHLQLEPFMRTIGENYDVPLLGLATLDDYAHLAFATKAAFFCRKPEGLAPPPVGPKCQIIDFNRFPAMSRLPTDDKGSFLGLFRMR